MTDPSPATHFLSSVTTKEVQEGDFISEYYVVLVFTNKATGNNTKHYHNIGNCKDSWRLWIEINEYKKAGAVLGWNNKLKQAVVPQ